MKKSNHKTAKEWQQDLKLETAPDVGLMRLLEQASEDKSLKNPKVKTSKYRFSKTAEMPKVTIQNALLQASLGELLAKARQDSGFTMQAVGEKLGLSRGRVAQIEGKSNLEIQTLVRQADVLGYDVVVTLKPRNKRKTALNTHL